MNSPTLPRLRLLKHSALGEDCWHSLLISLLRGLAAVEVAAAHLRAEFFPGLRGVANPALWYQALAFVTGFAHQAVVLFFLISGWLVGGSLLNRFGQPDALKRYAIDRITRLWTVLIPTFLFILALGMVTGVLDPRAADLASPDNPYSLLTFIGNLAGLQTVNLPQFGGNYPLWSLANESWYYLMFPLLVLCLAAGAAPRRLLAGTALAVIALLLPRDMVLYFAIWLLGAAFSRVQVDCGALARVALLLALATLSVVFRLKGSNDDLVAASFGQDFLLSLVFLLFLSSTQIRFNPQARMMAPVQRLAKLFSSFSFTLYVVHVPVLGMMGYLAVNLLGKNLLAPDCLGDLGRYLGMLAFVLLFAYGFYRLFEARTDAIRSVVRHAMMRPGIQVARAAPAKH